MYAVFLASLLTACLAVTGWLHALYLPHTDEAEGKALAANFLQYQKACQRACQAAVQEAGQEAFQEKAASGTLPDIRPYLPAGYARLGDWGMAVEGTADGCVLYVYGKKESQGPQRRLAVKDVWDLAKKQTGTGVKEGSILVPWNTALSQGISATIPEGAVVMAARIR